MPSTATITAFYSFTANTKARATQVNNNFDVFRGHLLPVGVSTASSFDNTYDLGSSEYRWRTGYFANIGANTTTGQLDFLSAGSTVGSIKSSGLINYRNTAILGYTLSADIGGFASRQISAGGLVTTTATNVAATTITIQTVGRPVSINLMPYENTAFSNSYIEGAKSTTGSFGATFYLMRDSSINVGNIVLELTQSTSTVYPTILRIPVGLSLLDFPAAGSHTYHFQYATGSNMDSAFLKVRMVAYEIN